MCLIVKDGEVPDDELMAPPKRLENLIHLGELCVDLLQQNDEHYSEVRTIHSIDIEFDDTHTNKNVSCLLPLTNEHITMYLKRKTQISRNVSSKYAANSLKPKTPLVSEIACIY